MQAAKLEPTYLDGPLNTRGDEKSGPLIDAVAAHALVSSAEINVLEIGPGGGIVLEGLANANLPKNILSRLSIVTLELFPSASTRLAAASQALRDRGAAVNPVTGNMASIPFRNESFDIVTASAVLHEVYSYEDGARSLKAAMAEAADVLKPGGVFLYRDIFGVEDSLQEPFEQTYSDPAWSHFVKRFLPNFIKTAKHPYNEDEINMRTDPNGSLVVGCPKGLARDIQRHYITFRDHIWRTQAIGVWPTEDSLNSTIWLDEPTLIKKIHFNVGDGIDPMAIPYAQDELGSYADGVTFDRFTDHLIAEGFDKTSPESVSKVEQEYLNWQEREGSEVYVYTTPSELVDLARTANPKVPLTVYPSDINIHPRSYYSGYLHRSLGLGALVDAKLAIQFRRLA